MTERKNINRGFKKLQVWQDAVSLYIIACKVFSSFPFELKNVSNNAIDAAHSISRNIAEGGLQARAKRILELSKRGSWFLWGIPFLL